MSTRESTSTNAEIIASVEKWQANGRVHPLTCARDKCGADLRPEEQEGKVVLVCPTCDYVQRWIPGVCLPA
jgi:hypothetical protein